MTEELIEEIDWEGNTVAVHPKSMLKQAMFPHKAALVIPKGRDGKYIISRRAADQYPFPDTWVCAIGGKAQHRESYLEAAVRETSEEAGTELDLVEVTRFKYDTEEYKAIFTIYTTERSVDIKSLDPDPEEIQYFREITLDRLRHEITTAPEVFAPTFRAAVLAFIYVLDNPSNNGSKLK